MLRFVIGALGAVCLFAGCTTSTIRSQEGQACSTSASDDPQLLCTPAQDLVCIATYTRLVTNAAEAGKFDGGIRQVYVCRLPCNTTADCLQPSDLCCLGTLFGKSYNKKGACTPPSSCELGEVESTDDGGATPDTGAPADAGASDVPAAQDTAPAAEGGAPADGGGAGS